MRSITIIVENTFMDAEVCRYILPYNPYKAIFGWYSNLCRRLKKDQANIEGIDKHFIRIRHFFSLVPKTDRMKIVFPSGFSLDSPFELNQVDRKIILLHLEGLRLATTNQLKKEQP